VITECYVCREPLDTEEAHTYHAEYCDLRSTIPCDSAGAVCSRFSGCGEDVHPQCCPTCTGQAV
jgi:hypothetical protein